MSKRGTRRVVEKKDHVEEKTNSKSKRKIKTLNKKTTKKNWYFKRLDNLNRSIKSRNVQIFK